jgi:dTDP-4-amino-4,6-dideoxygalactose transaminase
MNKNHDFIPIAKPWQGEIEASAVRRPISSGWVTQGPEVAAFEKEFADYVGSKYACAVSNCTTALHLALQVVGVIPDSEVITVSHSFIASANSVLYCGAIPVFVDIQPSTYNIDPEFIEAAITEKTRAILCVHQLGMPCDMRAILEIASKHKIPVVEDAACAIGSQIYWDEAWDQIGKPHGDIACFSFHPRKVITTGDGGMITTNNPEYDRQFRLLRHHGMSIPDTTRHESRQVVFEEFTELGYNYRLTDIQASIGREQLKRLPEIIPHRRLLAARYSELLSSIDGIGLPDEPEWAKSNWQSYCIRLPEGSNQLKVMQYMLDRNIATRRGVMCVHREPAYSKNPWNCVGRVQDCDCSPGSCENLRESELAQDNCIVLPLFHELSASDQDRVVETFEEALTHTHGKN